MKDKKAFGRFIAEKRKQLNLTQSELAEKLYVTKTAVSKWERGVTYPDITLIGGLCDALGVDEHELIAEGNCGEFDRIRGDARKFRKISALWFRGFTAAYAVAITVCFISNLATAKTLDWFFIVLTAVATAFCLFPSVSRFIKRGKFAAVSASFTAALSLLLLTCSLYSRGNWFFKAFTAVLLAYVCLALPVIIKLYALPERIKRHAALICVSANFSFTLILLVSCLYSSPADLGRAAVIALYFFAPATACAAVIVYLKTDRLIKAAALGAVTAYFAQAAVNGLFGLPYTFAVNFSNWGEEYINQNIITLAFAALMVCAAVLLACGLFRRAKK